MTRDQIVSAARSWLGTRWQHQASRKGVAADCVGLVRGIYAEVTGSTVPVAADYPATWHLFKAEERLYGEALKYADEIPVESARAGDLLLFGFGKGPAHHCGIMTGPDTFVHSYMEAGKVVEGNLDAKIRGATWRGHIRAAFRFPGVTD